MKKLELTLSCKGGRDILKPTDNHIKYRKVSSLLVSIFILVTINIFSLFYLFIDDAILTFLGFFIYGAFLLGYIVSVIKSLRSKGNKRILALFINLLTPIICISIFALNLPIYVNFYLLYPLRMDIIKQTEFIAEDTLECKPILYPCGFEINDTTMGKRVYFKIREEFLLSSDFPDNVDITPSNSGFEYSKNGFSPEKNNQNIISLNENWRYVINNRLIQ